MSQKTWISKVVVRGHPYLGVCDDPVNGMPAHAWSDDPDRVMNWLADGSRFRFNQHRSKRLKYVVEVGGRLAEEADGTRVLTPIGGAVEDITDSEARKLHSFLAAMPMQILQAPERLEATEWWSAVKRRKTNIGRGRPGGAMPRFRAKGRCDQSFVCWHNGGRNAIYTRTARRSGVVVITGQNPADRRGDSDWKLHWEVRIKIRVSQPIRPYTSVRVNWTRQELIFVSPPLPVSGREHSGEVIGLDRGVTRALAGSGGEFWDAPDTAQVTAKIRYQSKRMAKSRRVAAVESRNFWESRRYQARKAAASELSAKKARILDDWRHKTTTEIVRGFNLIGIEDLSLTDMTRAAKGTGAASKRGLNRGLTSVGLADIRTKLEYKSDLVGASVVGVNPAYTSQRCNNCGHTAKENRESQAVFRCQKCAHSDNADTNAAKNIRGDAIEIWARAWPKRGASMRPITLTGPATTVPAAAATKRKPPAFAHLAR